MSDVVERVATEITTALGEYFVGAHSNTARRALSALRPGDVLPSGLVVVPAEPTAHMIGEGQASLDFTPIDECEAQALKVWSAMLAAAKEPDDDQ